MSTSEHERSCSKNESVTIGYAYGSYNLFNGFDDVYQGSIQNLQLAKAELQLHHQELIIGSEVEEQFHAYIFKKKSIALIEEALATNDKHRKLADRRRAAGLASEADIAEFDLKDSLLRSELTSFELGVEEARIGLKRLLGREIGGNIEPVGTLQSQRVKTTLEEILNKIADTTDDVLLGSRDVEISKIRVKMLRSEWLPKLDLEARFGYLPFGEGVIDRELNSSLLLLAKWDLFSGFASQNAFRESLAAQERTELTLKHKILTSVTEAELYFRKLKVIEKRVALERQNEVQAEKYYQAVMTEYQRGIKNSADVNAAAEQLFSVRVKREAYKFDFLEQKVRMEKALCMTIETEILAE